MAHPSRHDVEPIPFFEAHSYGYLPVGTGVIHGSSAVSEPRMASVTDWDAPLACDFGDDMYSTPPPVDACQNAYYAASTVTVPLDLVPQKRIDSQPTPLTKTTVKKTRAPRTKTANSTKTTKSSKSRLNVLAEEAIAAVEGLDDDTSQVTRKSEIEKKSRLKRASNIDTMKAQVTLLEQSLLRVATKYHSQDVRQASAFHDPTHHQLPLHTRLVKMRELLASQVQESVYLRNEHFLLYQRLQHFVDMNASLRNVVSAHTFTDATVYDLLSWWKPPSDAQCKQLADESMAKIHAFTFSKRHAADEHAGWKLAYEHSAQEGCKFMITRDISQMNVAAVAQTIWDARYTNEGANQLAGSICKVDISVLKAVNKDMVVINRSIRFPDFAVHTLYLMFRTEIDGVLYIVSRELGRSHHMTWDQSTHDFPETSADKWVDVFTWSSFTKMPYDPTATVCGSRVCAAEKGVDGMVQTHRMNYGGWWGTSYALGVRRWLLEMLFMVVRWEALHIQPLVPMGARLTGSHIDDDLDA